MEKHISVLALTLFLGACTSAIHKPVVLDTSPATSISLDGKQRMIVAIEKGKDKQKVVCAEPSPDALVGIAASASAGLGLAGKGNLDVAGSLAEAVQTVGKRTQTIQLLRDGLYRACEAYMNGAISKGEYKVLLSRIDDFAVVLVALDGITGGLNVPATALRPETKSSSGAKKSGSGNGDAEAAEADANVTSETKAGAEPPTMPDIQISGENAKEVVKIIKLYLQHQRMMHGVKDEGLADEEGED